MRAGALALFALLCTGCSTVDPISIENRVACTLDRREAHVLSKWWSFSIGSQIAASDARELCKKAS